LNMFLDSEFSPQMYSLLVNLVFEITIK
jgi:hypothetical protein